MLVEGGGCLCQAFGMVDGYAGKASAANLKHEIAPGTMTVAGGAGAIWRKATGHVFFWGLDSSSSKITQSGWFTALDGQRRLSTQPEDGITKISRGGGKKLVNVFYIWKTQQKVTHWHQICIERCVLSIHAQFIICLPLVHHVDHELVVVSHMLAVHYVHRF